MIKDSELIINEDGSIYHLCLKPGDIGETIITVGDPERVNLVSQFLDKIILTKTNREFKTVTGYLSQKKVTIIATGIGTDNIDIVFNELDALVNIDFEKRLLKEDKTQLSFIRIGTSGAIRQDIPIDSTVLSKYAIGLDGLLNYYADKSCNETQLEEFVLERTELKSLYAVSCDLSLLQKFSSLGNAGITITADGFYGPQSRSIRLKSRYNLVEELQDISYQNLHCTNLEMETAGIYGLSQLLGHRAISINAILANRYDGAFSVNPQKTVITLIEKVMQVLRNS